jgi:hypothetical protein
MFLLKNVNGRCRSECMEGTSVWNGTQGHANLLRTHDLPRSDGTGCRQNHSKARRSTSGEAGDLKVRFSSTTHSKWRFHASKTPRIARESSL